LRRATKARKIVSKKRSALAKKSYASGLGKWTKAVQAARKALGIKGFAIIGGKTAQGKALHAKAKALYTSA